MAEQLIQSHAESIGSTVTSEAENFAREETRKRLEGIADVVRQFLILGLPLICGLYGIYRTIDGKEEELVQIISYYATDFAKEQNQERMENETEIRAKIISYEALSVQEDTKYLSAELTNMLRFPQQYTAQNLPNANKEIVPAGTVYTHFSPELQSRIDREGLSPQLQEEMTLLSNAAVTMETLRRYL